MTFVSIAEVFGTVAAALGGYEGVKWLVSFMANRKQEKRIKNSEASRSEIDVSEDTFHLYEERLKEQREANSVLNNQIIEMLKSGARKDAIIEDKTGKIRELNEARIDDQKIIARLERTVQYYQSWKCFREYGDGEEQCMRRKPAQNPPLKYEPIDGVM